MRALLLDTSFIYALFSPYDSLHELAQRWLASLREQTNIQFITTRTVLVEFLALCSGGAAAWRQTAADYVATVLAGPEIDVIVESDELFESGLRLYRSRPDKAYSMADCLAMELCRERGITEVLTFDRDFVREGFRALLREEPEP